MLELLSSSFSEILRPQILFSYGSNAKISPDGNTIVILDYEKSSIYFYDKHRDGVFHLTTQLFNYYFKNQNVLGRVIKFNKDSTLCAVSTDGSNFIDFEANIDADSFTTSCVIFSRVGNNQIPKKLPNGDVVYEDTFMWQHFIGLKNLIGIEIIADIYFAEVSPSDNKLYIATISKNTFDTKRVYIFDLQPVYNAIANKNTIDITNLPWTTTDTVLYDPSGDNFLNSFKLFDVNVILDNISLKLVKFEIRNETCNILHLYYREDTLSIPRKITLSENIIDYDVYDNTNIAILTNTKINIYNLTQVFASDENSIIPVSEFIDISGQIIYDRIHATSNTMIVSSLSSNLVNIYSKIGNNWVKDKTLTGKDSFGNRISLSNNGLELVITEPYENRCWRYFYEPLAGDWLSQKIESKGFGNNFIVDASENVMVISNANERTLDIFENVSLEQEYSLSKSTNFTHNFNLMDIQQIFSNTLGTKIYVQFKIPLSSYYFLGVYDLDNERNIVGASYTRIGDLISQVRISHLNREGDIMYSKSNNVFFKTFSDKEFYYTVDNSTTADASQVEFNDNFNTVYVKKSDVHYMYQYFTGIIFKNTNQLQTKLYKDFYLNKSQLENTFENDLSKNILSWSINNIYDKYIIKNQPYIHILNRPSSDLFIGFDKKDTAYFYQSPNKIILLHPKEEYNKPRVLDISLNSYSSSQFFIDVNQYIFYPTSQSPPQIYYIDASNNNFVQFQTNLNALNLPNSASYTFTKGNMFVHYNNLVKHFVLEITNTLIGQQVSKTILFHLKNTLTLESNIRNLFIGERKDLIIVTDNKIVVCTNQDSGDKEWLHIKRFYETKPDYDIRTINKQFYYNVNRILGSKFISNYADKYKDDNTYVVDEFECFFTQQFNKNGSLVGEYVVNYDTPLIFRDKNINKYIDSSKHRTRAQLLNFIEQQNKRSKIFNVSITNYIKGDTNIRNGLPQVGPFIGVAFGFLAAYILLFGPTFIPVSIQAATIIIIVFAAKELAKFEELKNSGVFSTKVFDPSNNQIDFNNFFRYNNDEPSSKVEIPADNDNSRYGGDGWRYRLSPGNNPEFYYDPFTDTYSNRNVPYTELLTEDKIGKFVIEYKHDLLNDAINPYTINRGWYSDQSFKNSSFYYTQRIKIQVMKRLDYPTENYVDKFNTIFGKKMDITPDGKHIVLNSDLNTLCMTDIDNTTANFYSSKIYTSQEGPNYEDSFTATKTAFRNWSYQASDVLTVGNMQRNGMDITNISPNLTGNYSTLQSVINAVNAENAVNPNSIKLDYETYASVELNFYGGNGWVNWGQIFYNDKSILETDSTGVANVNWHYVATNSAYFPPSKNRNAGCFKVSSEIPSTLDLKYCARFSTVAYQEPGDFPDRDVLKAIYSTINLSGYKITVEITGVVKLNFTDEYLKKYVQKMLRFSIFNFYDLNNLNWIQTKSFVFNKSKEYKPKTLPSVDTYLRIEKTQQTITSEDLLNEAPFEQVYTLRDGLVLGFKNKTYVCIDKNNIPPEINNVYGKFDINVTNEILKYDQGVSLVKVDQNTLVMVYITGNRVCLMFYKINELNNIKYSHFIYHLNGSINNSNIKNKLYFDGINFFRVGNGIDRMTLNQMLSLSRFEGSQIAAIDPNNFSGDSQDMPRIFPAPNYDWYTLNPMFIQPFDGSSGDPDPNIPDPPIDTNLDKPFLSLNGNIYEEDGVYFYPSSQPWNGVTINTNSISRAIRINGISYSPNRDYYVAVSNGGLGLVSFDQGLNWNLFEFIENSFSAPTSFNPNVVKYYDLQVCMYFEGTFIVAGQSRIYSLKPKAQTINNAFDMTREKFDFEGATGPNGELIRGEGSYSIQGIAANKRRVVVVGNGGFVGYKNFGQTIWKQVKLEGMTSNLNSIIFDGSYFIATGDESVILTSVDGTIWVQVDSNFIPPLSGANDIPNRGFSQIVHINEPDKRINYGLIALQKRSANSNILRFSVNFVNHIRNQSQNIDIFTRSSRNTNEFMSVYKNYVSILTTTNEHTLLETNRFRIQDQVGRMILDNVVYNCIPERGLVIKYEKTGITDILNEGEQIYQDNSYLYFGANIASFGDYDLIDTNQGVIVFRHRNDPNIKGLIETNSIVENFADKIITRSNIYFNDPDNNKIYIVNTIPYINISQ